MSKTIITEKDTYPIQPEHINTGKHFFAALDNAETETSANYIVGMCQRNGGWVPFTGEEIESFYNEAGNKEFTFNRLLSEGFVVRGDDNKYRVTHEFIVACFASSPTPEALGIVVREVEVQAVCVVYTIFEKGESL